jgi:hypothetical protein
MDNRWVKIARKMIKSHFGSKKMQDAVQREPLFLADLSLAVKNNHPYSNAYYDNMTQILIALFTGGRSGSINNLKLNSITNVTIVNEELGVVEITIAFDRIKNRDHGRKMLRTFEGCVHQTEAYRVDVIYW